MAQQTLTILLADDMAHFLDLELSFLRRADCKIITASDGAQALVVAKREAPDLLLLDVEMPRMTGIEVCRLLRQDAGFKKTPIVMVTSTDRRAEAMQAGATDFWQKPIKESEFLDGIRRLVPIKIREDERLSIGLPVTVEYSGKSAEGMTRDISDSGAFILVRAGIAPGADVTCRVRLGFDRAPEVAVSGKVARAMTGDDGGIGVEFVGPDAEIKKLRDYLKSKR